jgi:hypothetical protein
MSLSSAHPLLIVHKHLLDFLSFVSLTFGEESRHHFQIHFCIINLKDAAATVCQTSIRQERIGKFFLNEKLFKVNLHIQQKSAKQILNSNCGVRQQKTFSQTARQVLKWQK